MRLSKGGTLVALCVFFISPVTWAENTAHDVIVVGAGSAGLYAAKNLIDDGYDVLLIEATDRIGGRVYSRTLGQTRIEMGAEEHYPTNSNPAWPAIKGEYGNSIYVAAYQGIEAYSMDGGTNTCWWKSSATRDCSDDSDVAQVEGLYNWYWKPQNHTDATTTLADDVKDEYGVEVGDRSYHIFDSSFAGGSYATNLDKLGARSLALQDNEWDLGPASVQVIGDKDLGYSDALETVWWNDVVANSDLLLDSPVVAIDTSGADVIVTVANGDLHAARQVIVTVSIGVLQAEIIDFIPDLPTSTVDAYNGIGFDKGMKVAMRFGSVWWETENDPLRWLVTEGLAGACWVPSDYKDYTPGSPDNIMMCYPMGDNAQTLTDLAANGYNGQFGDAAIVAAILDDLDATLPLAPANAASSAYLDSVVQNWGAAPYTLGPYSYPKIDTYTTASNNKRGDLQVPVAGNRIYFAGEGSHETHPSTVVGALHEGERAATDVATVNGNPNDPPPIPVPEPGTVFGLATGGALLWFLAGNRRRQRVANS